MGNSQKEAISSVLRGYFPMAQALTLEEIADEIYNCIPTTSSKCANTNSKAAGTNNSGLISKIIK